MPYSYIGICNYYGNRKKEYGNSRTSVDRSKQKETIITPPILELRNIKCKKNYKILHAMLKNVSNNTICAMGSISFEIISASKVITKSDKVAINMSTFLSNEQEIEIVFNTKESITRIVKDRNAMNKICFLWSFVCEDTYHKIHYYKATIELEDIDDFSRKMWNVEKVG